MCTYNILELSAYVDFAIGLIRLAEAEPPAELRLALHPLEIVAIVSEQIGARWLATGGASLPIVGLRVVGLALRITL